MGSSARSGIGPTPASKTATAAIHPRANRRDSTMANVLEYEACGRSRRNRWEHRLHDMACGDQMQSEQGAANSPTGWVFRVELRKHRTAEGSRLGHADRKTLKPARRGSRDSATRRPPSLARPPKRSSTQSSNADVGTSFSRPPRHVRFEEGMRLLHNIAYYTVFARRLEDRFPDEAAWSCVVCGPSPCQRILDRQEKRAARS